MTIITIYRHYCKGCEICSEVCPKDVLKMVVATDRWEGSIVEVVNMDNCNACMLCEHQCPDFAIEVRSLKKEKRKKAKEKIAGEK
ncbi:4Fe-4S binding protein [bacterium]|nr:4Fe-4S binding protein [bacterium]